jgi:hypothetical protein
MTRTFHFTLGPDTTYTNYEINLQLTTDINLHNCIYREVCRVYHISAAGCQLLTWGIGSPPIWNFRQTKWHTESVVKFSPIIVVPLILHIYLSQQLRQQLIKTMTHPSSEPDQQGWGAVLHWCLGLQILLFLQMVDWHIHQDLSLILLG